MTTPFSIESLKITSLSAMLGFLLAGELHAAIPQGNLIVNGSGASPLATGWTVIANGGSGWAQNGGGGYDATPGFFITSYVQCRRSQTIDLLALGATAEELDTAPVIRVSEAISSYLQGTADKYYIKVELRDASNAVLAVWNQGTQTAPLTAPSSWTVFSAEFKNYGPGVRYIYFEDGGIDSGYWGGYYGTYHDAASVQFIPDTDSDGMPDEWETANGTNPNVDDANADLDGDTLSNIDEMTLGTRPDLRDTDADGYDDPYEDKFGSWLDAQHTGTDPLKPDTDADGILDGLENPDLPYLDETQPGTDPNKADTDSDGMPDLAEIANASDPTNPGSVPTFTYGNVMVENFDGVSVNSTYAFTQSAGTFAPAVAASGVTQQANAARLTLTGSGNSNTSIAWNSVSSNARSVRLTFDFRMSADVSGEAADGFGIGFFKTSAYGTAGGSNPGYTPALDLNWENPDVGSGLPNAVVFGFDIYGGTTAGNTVRLTGPAAGTPLLSSAVPSFQLNAGVFHRVVITAITNGASSTVFSLQIINDVNGAATVQNLISNVVVPGFDITADTFRLIAGGRTGGSTVTTELDNIALQSTTVLPPMPVVLSAEMDRTTNPPAFAITWSSVAGVSYVVQSSETLAAPWTAVQTPVTATGTTTTLRIPVPSGSAQKKFFRVGLAP